MANESVLTNNQGIFTQIVFRDSTDFGTAPNTAANSLLLSNPDFVQIDLTSGATDVSRQSVKADFGATRAPQYRVDACMELASAATTLETIDFYWAGSPSATAGTGNPTDITGTDAVYAETPALLAQLQRIGSLTLDADTLSIGFVGFVIPTHRYGSIVIINRATPAFHTVMDETHVTLTPVAFGN